MKLSLQPVEDAPSGWIRLPLQAIGNQHLERNKGLRNDNLLSLSYGLIKNKDIDSNEGLLPESFETYQLVQPGDIIFRFTDLQNDLRSLRSAIVTEPGIITSAYLCFRPNPKRVSPQYLNYLMRAYDLAKVFYAFGGGVRQSLKYDEVRNLPIALPPRAEQDAIVEFLDRELDLIDRMLEKQLDIKNLLAERRTSYILRVISKGTRNKHSLKHSGVSWLGSIPENWELSPLRRLSRVQRGASPRPIDDERYFDPQGEYGWVRISDVTASGMFLTQTEQKLSALGASLSVKMKPGDLFLSIAGSYGKAAIAGENVCIHDGFVWFPELARRRIHIEWLYWVFESGKLFDGLGKLGTQVNLNTSIVGEVKVAVPSFEEQVEISENLKNFVLEEELLSAANENYTKLLRERRAALISGAVSGHLDVKGFRHG